jgi:phosphatidylserine synthase
MSNSFLGHVLYLATLFSFFSLDQTMIFCQMLILIFELLMLIFWSYASFFCTNIYFYWVLFISIFLLRMLLLSKGRYKSPLPYTFKWNVTLIMYFLLNLFLHMLLLSKLIYELIYKPFIIDWCLSSLQHALNHEFHNSLLFFN